MNKLLIATVLMILAFCHSATADVWRWTDPNDVTHFVDTNKPIFAWRDDAGKVHFSDKPAHVDAVLVQLIWHSAGTLAEIGHESDGQEGAEGEQPVETAEERAEREKAEAYYCKRAREIYESYVNAPRLYETGHDGKPVYLNDREAAKTIKETKAKVAEVCG